MWLAVKAFFGANTGKVLEWLSIAGGITAAIASIFRAGEKSQAAAQLAKEQKEIEVAHNVEDKNRAELHDGDAAQRLRDQWSR